MGDSVLPIQVAFCAVGNLGGPICDALAESPHAVSVFDPRREALEPRVARGARAATSVAEAAGEADVLVVMVRDDAQVREVVLGRATMRPIDPTARGADLAYVDRMSPMVTLGCKDLDDAFHLADELGLDLPVARAARPLWGPALGIALDPTLTAQEGPTG